MGTKRSRKKAGAGQGQLSEGGAGPSFDDFFADTTLLRENAKDARDRGLTFRAAIIKWRDEDIASVAGDESGEFFGWAMRRYVE